VSPIGTQRHQPDAAAAGSPATWDGRVKFVLTNGLVEATLLPGGGHIASWRFASPAMPSQQNVLWESPWRTADPGTPDHTAIAAQCGDDSAARFLASFTGHALCLDGFGPPTAAEDAAGVALHGEAATSTWSISDSDASHVAASVTLPIAGLLAERHFSLQPGESVLRADERVTNLRDVPRNLHWVQHATFGRLGAAGASRVTASVSRGQTWPLDYDNRNLLARQTEFSWPLAPGADGSNVDLRELFAKSGYGFVAAAHQTTGRKHGFVAECNGEARLAFGYLFNTNSFPWVTFWEENKARRAAPWLATTQARGLEFGTTPLPLGITAIEALGPVLGERTCQRIEAHQTLRAPWLIFIAEVPHDWQEVEEVRVESDALVLLYNNQQKRIAARGVERFLDGEPTEEQRSA
jgi:hypothetical protein